MEALASGEYMRIHALRSPIFMSGIHYARQGVHDSPKKSSVSALCSYRETSFHRQLLHECQQFQDGFSYKRIDTDSKVAKTADACAAHCIKGQMRLQMEVVSHRCKLVQVLGSPFG
jgi:hypothetical protein